MILHKVIEATKAFIHCKVLQMLHYSMTHGFWWQDYNEDGKLSYSEFTELISAFGNDVAASKV